MFEDWLVYYLGDSLGNMACFLIYFIVFILVLIGIGSLCVWLFKKSI